MPSRTDIAVAGVALGLDLAVVNGLPPLSALLGTVYVVIGYAPILWRRHAPLLVFGSVWALQVVSLVWVPDFRAVFAPVVVLYAVALLGSRAVSLLALAAEYAVLLVSALPSELDRDESTPMAFQVVVILLLYGLIAGLAWALGRWVRHSRSTIDDLEERRARAAAEAEANERQRLARELHDILSHSVSVIVLQAVGGRKVMASDPARAAEAFSHIETVGKASMDELRRLVNVIPGGRTEAGGMTVADPRPGLAQLPALVESLRHGGLAVEQEETGQPCPLDASVDLSAYRIAQEGLTNSLKHGGPDVNVVVSLDWRPRALCLEVRDDGHGTTDPALSTGHGLAGIRARTQAVGGEVEAGPVEGGGFRLRALLPVSPGPPG